MLLIQAGVVSHCGLFVSEIQSLLSFQILMSAIRIDVTDLIAVW